MPETNQVAPDFELLDDQGLARRLSAFRGRRVLLVFYPGDNTPICTRQLCDYRDGIEAFGDLGTEVIGISGDDAASHAAFRSKHQLPFILLTDPQLKVAARYGCKGLLGMKRGVFLIDEEGCLRWQHVESLALFRRSRDELIKVIASLDNA